MRNGQKLRLEPELVRLMDNSKDYQELLWAWQNFHDVAGVPVKESFFRQVVLQNNIVKKKGLDLILSNLI